MKWKDLRETIGALSPRLGGLVAGPAGAAVGALIAQAMGVGESPEEVSSAIKKDPTSYLKLKALETEKELELARYEAETYKAELQGVQNARETHRHSPMPAVICICLTLMVGLGAYALFTLSIPDENAEIAWLLFGTALAKWGDSIAYWVGSTRGSASKTMMMNPRGMA